LASIAACEKLSSAGSNVLKRPGIAGNVLVQEGVDGVPVQTRPIAQRTQLLVGGVRQVGRPFDIVALGVPGDQRSQMLKLAG
jgi:hypothetical protein